MNLGEGLQLNAIKHPRKTAIVYGGERISYAQLNHRANRLANGVMGLGLEKGDKAAIYLHNCREYMEAIFGLAKLGVVLVPLNPRLAKAEVEYIVNQSNTKLFITDAEGLEMVEALLPDLNHTSTPRWLMVGRKAPPGTIPWEGLLTTGSEGEPAISVGETDWCYIGYTSGTTGFPKGALFTHRCRILRTIIYALEHGLGEEDTALTVAPIHHAAPFAFSIIPLYLGGTLVILRDFDPLMVLKTIQEERITSIFMVPTMYHMMLGLSPPERAEWDTSSLRVLVSGGAPLSLQDREGIIEGFPSAGLYEFYGGTETGMITLLKPRDQLRKGKSVGQPMLGTSVRLLDDQGRDVPVGEVGELNMQGPFMFDGYYQMPEATQEVLRNGWLTLGDLAQCDEEGYYYIVDRKRDMIISGGANIYPAEVERVLSTHSKVEEVAVIGVPDEKWGESVKAMVVLRKGQRAVAEELIQFCRGLLADYKIPRSVDFLAALPRTPSGKVLKRQMRDAFWEGRGAKV